MNYEIKQKDKFKYIEIGEGEPLVLLHGLFGALSNFKDLIDHFSTHYKVVVPMLPLLEMDILHTSVGGLAKFVHKFIEARDYQGVHLLGNSLGGACWPGPCAQTPRKNKISHPYRKLRFV